MHPQEYALHMDHLGKKGSMYILCNLYSSNRVNQPHVSDAIHSTSSPDDTSKIASQVPFPTSIDHSEGLFSCTSVDTRYPRRNDAWPRSNIAAPNRRLGEFPTRFPGKRFDGAASERRSRPCTGSRAMTGRSLISYLKKQCNTSSHRMACR